MKIFDLLTEKKSETTATAAATSTTATTGSEAVENPTIHNLIILDASGSMSLIYNQALTGVNETLQTIRQAAAENPEMPQTVTLASFSTAGYREIYSNIKAEYAVDINPSQYCPNGGTPLYDAIGKGVNEIAKVKKEKDSVLVTIVTDGEENSSREYSGQAIKALIESKRGQGWVFTYIGANQNVEAVAATLSINHSLCFAATATGTAEMWEHENASRRKFYGKLKGKLNDPMASPMADDEDYEF